MNYAERSQELEHERITHAAEIGELATRQATDLAHLAEGIARERIDQERAAQKATNEKAAREAATPAVAPAPVPVPQAAWAALERLQLAAVEEKARA